MRSYVPNVSSNSNICQDFFETMSANRSTRSNRSSVLDVFSDTVSIATPHHGLQTFEEPHRNRARRSTMSDISAPDPEAPRTRRRKTLSAKQMAILEVIQTSIAQHGYPPSMREIGDAVNLKSLSSVTHQLGQLELSGYLRRDPGKTRAMEVLIDLPGTSGENPADSVTP